FTSCHHVVVLIRSRSTQIGGGSSLASSRRTVWRSSSSLAGTIRSALLMSGQHVVVPCKQRSAQIGRRSSLASSHRALCWLTRSLECGRSGRPV
ncbi:hypothetical protein PMAYCL1PPCAC_11372, partial [Pristionchus mayeri]